MNRSGGTAANSGSVTSKVANQPDEDELLEMLERLTSGAGYKTGEIEFVARKIFDDRNFISIDRFATVASSLEMKEKIKNVNLNVNQFFFIVNRSGVHWTLLCITKLDNDVFVLYKDPLGMETPVELKESLKEIFSRNSINFKEHLNKEQADATSGGPMSLKNMDIMIDGLRLNKTDYIKSFESDRRFYQKFVDVINQIFRKRRF